MTLKKNDFIEVEFVGKLENGEVFDSNIKQELEKLNPQAKAKPFIFPLGNQMFIQGVDDFLIGKESEKKYTIPLTPEKAFGKRNSEFIKLIPMSAFKQQQTQPQQGMVFNFDNQLGKVVSVSGGRVLVDFNHPLAGKPVNYEINVKKQITDLDEKIKSLIDFFFRKDLKYDLDEKNKKLTIHADQKTQPYILLFKDKFKEILDLDLQVKEVKEKPQEENKTHSH